MKLSTVLVTGSSGLIGSEVVKRFDRQGTGAPPYCFEANSGRFISFAPFRKGSCTAICTAL